ncbi:hypothetical protein NP568_24395, partial [Vibrio parahaemolyticus]|nr:hypothetical protein [Vibrio parahaemolyticus]
GISFCESEELPYLKDIQKLIGLHIPVVKDHPWVTVEVEKAQAVKTEELKEKAKANKVYRGSKAMVIIGAGRNRLKADKGKAG